MDKITYLAELAEGLARWVPERERQDILIYYAEYFEEAGSEREAEVIQELGDPWALSCRLAVEGGFVSQEQANAWTPPKKKRWPWILIGAAAVLIFVVGSVASAAIRVGSFVGRNVAAFVTEDEIAVEAEPGYSIPTKPPRPYIEEETEYFGGFWSMEDGDLDEFDSIDVDIALGNITVCVGDDYTLYTNESSGVDGFSLNWGVKGGTLKVKDSSSGYHVGLDGLKDLFSGNTIDVTITVPEEAMLDKVHLQTGMGDVFVSGIIAEKVEAESGTGNVECYEPRQVKQLDLDTGTGNVMLAVTELYEGLEIDMESGTGNVEAILNCSEADCRYELESGMGSVSVNSADRGSKSERRSSGSPYKLEAESGLGNVEISFLNEDF